MQINSQTPEIIQMNRMYPNHQQTDENQNKRSQIKPPYILNDKPPPSNLHVSSWKIVIHQRMSSLIAPHHGCHHWETGGCRFGKQKEKTIARTDE